MPLTPENVTCIPPPLYLRTRALGLGPGGICPMPYAPPCFDVTLPVPDWAELSEHVAPEGGADV